MNHLRIINYAVASLLLGSCTNPTSPTPNADEAEKPKISDSTTLSSTEENNYEDRFIVVLDTGKVYSSLDAEMYRLSAATKLRADTLNRHYDAGRKEIILAEDDEDEMFRGEYYPRRIEDSIFISAEHSTQFIRGCEQGSFALVADICTTQKRADSVVAILKPLAPKAFVVQTPVYMGCMH